jgi:hypothetical protein
MTVVINTKHPIDGSALKLEVTTDDERKIEMCTKYWLLDEAEGNFVYTVSELEIHFCLSVTSIGNTVKKYSRLFSSNYCCKDCGQPVAIANRTAYRERPSRRSVICTPCFIKSSADKGVNVDRLLGVLGVKNKRIDLSTKKPKSESLEERKGIYSEFKAEFIREAPDLWNLDVKTRFYLMALIFTLGDEGTSHTRPLNSSQPCCLSPRPEYDIQILRHLVDNTVILPSFSDDEAMLKLWAEQGRFICDFNRCGFEMAYSYDDVCQLFGELDDYTSSGMAKSSEFIDLCREVQLNECLAFIEDQFNHRQLTWFPNPKFNRIFATGLETYSVSQVYGFIWRAVKNIATDKNQEIPSGSNVTNRVAGYISRSLEKSVKEGWKIQRFQRIKLPKSFISHLIFESTLNKGALSDDDSGFNRSLNEILGIGQKVSRWVNIK